MSKEYTPYIADISYNGINYHFEFKITEEGALWRQSFRAYIIQAPSYGSRNDSFRITHRLGTRCRTHLPSIPQIHAIAPASQCFPMIPELPRVKLPEAVFLIEHPVFLRIRKQAQRLSAALFHGGNDTRLQKPAADAPALIRGIHRQHTQIPRRTGVMMARRTRFVIHCRPCQHIADAAAPQRPPESGS